MTLRSSARCSWLCAPVVGAFLVSRVAWASDRELLIDDLERTNTLAKRLQITMDEVLILEVHCMLNGALETSVDFLIPIGLPTAQKEVAHRLVADATDLAAREHLVGRPVGFGRR